MHDGGSIRLPQPALCSIRDVAGFLFAPMPKSPRTTAKRLSAGGQGGQALRVEMVPIESLCLDPANVNTHPDRNLDAIKASLRRFGFQKPLVVDVDNIVRAGNGTLIAAKSLGMTHVPIHRTSLRGAEATAYAISDNRSASLAEWDASALEAQLAELSAEGFDVDADLAFSEAELKALLAESQVDNADVPDAEPQIDRAEELRQQWGVEPGQLWEIAGNATHRLLCGDSTKREDVERLLDGAVPFIMVTDPPYGVEYDADWRDEFNTWAKAATANDVQNDDVVDWSAAYKLSPAHVAYVWHAGRFAAELVVSLRAAGYVARTQIIWRKPTLIMGRGHYHWQHEPCWYAVRKGGSAKWCGDRTQSTIWEIQGMHAIGRKEERAPHPTQKPLECMARPIRNHGDADDDVHDPFLGSGTTMVAAEGLARRCYAMEMSPAYVAVSLQRMTDVGATCRRLD